MLPWRGLALLAWALLAWALLAWALLAFVWLFWLLWLLVRIQSDNPDRGFTLTFSDTKVTIEGENLLPLFDSLREHRAAEITEADRTELMQAEGE